MNAEGYSLCKAAELLDMPHVTLFYWRHKILSALKRKDFEKIAGIVEMDETYFLYSEKGKRKVTGRKSCKETAQRRNGASVKNRSVC